MIACCGAFDCEETARHPHGGTKSSEVNLRLLTVVEAFMGNILLLDGRGEKSNDLRAIVKRTKGQKSREDDTNAGSLRGYRNEYSETVV